MGLERITQPQIFVNTTTFQGTLSGTQIISTNLSALNAVFSSVSGTFYGDGTKLIGVYPNQSAINTFLADLSANTTFQKLSVVNLTATNAVFSTASAVSYFGTYYGDATKLTGVYPGQSAVNAFVTANSADSKINSLSARFIHTEYVGNTLFKTASSAVITQNVLNSATTFNGVFYGDGTKLLGVYPGQSAINAFVNSLTGNATFRSISAVSATFISVSAATLSGTFYGDGSNLLGVTTGGRRFFYETIGDTSFTYAGSTIYYTTLPSASAWKIVKVQYALDGSVVGLSARDNVAWTDRAILVYYP